ncbi:signal peptide peptidase SppA [Haloprofundus marisrubri]|uniref:Signal peptide peptidase SppA n=1 Tax=Haloprofundus marisrubri TaxID=1514971 RepID=A0A0W1R8W1_9EURY|nr:signal peptide peptidase SppA [Haloprofundus marisrubri]KTG09837.1 signal peptide peptidase SppA [Haloprofundus marisrubri]
MNTRVATVERLLIVAVGVAVSALVGWWLFYDVPDTFEDLVGVVLVLLTVVAGARLASGIAASRVSAFNVAEVAVEGPISRGGGRGPLPTGSAGTPADDIVDQIERADDGDAQALLLKLNTPGGEVVPSDDIRKAAIDFDGPTVAYTTDTCASGGYWIASGCDELWAREASIVGSIGVIGSSVNVHELAEQLGISYERFAAGKYKDAGVALKEPDDDDRAYLQGIIDRLYDHFVERVAEGRGMDPETIRETEARVYIGTDAHELGLVDELGTRDDVEDRVSELLGTDAVVQEFEPQQGLSVRLRRGAEGVAYALGAGLSSRFDTDGVEFKF